MRNRTRHVAIAVLLAAGAATAASHAADPAPEAVRSAVDRAIRPVMEKYGIPGMAVAITVKGTPYVFDYGVASTENHRPVTHDTLFEIGSVSKTFTATLASWAQVNGQLSLSDKTGKYLPALRGSPFGEVSLLNLGTHTPGGLPLQVPENIRDNDQLMAYFKAWQPAYRPGTYRTYANPGIGLLGLIAARSMNQDFAVLMEARLFPALGMKHSYIHVPQARMKDYAQGYTAQGAPVRMADAVLSAQAYGVKTTASDLIRFVAANMSLVPLDGKLQRAITDTHTGYFKVGEMTQDLIWEQYAYPVPLKTLVAGNAPAVILDAMPVTPITPPQPPRQDVLINKTGSTNGFGAYVAFVPQTRTGIAILANKNYPNAERVAIAHQLLMQLGD